MPMTISSDMRFPRCMADATNILVYLGTINLGTYATGGIDASEISDLFRYLLFLGVMSNSGYSFDYDTATDKVLAYVAGAEVADTTDLSTDPGALQFLAIGFKT